MPNNYLNLLLLLGSNHCTNISAIRDIDYSNIVSLPLIKALVSSDPIVPNVIDNF